MEQPQRYLSGFPTVDSETVLLLECHTFFSNLSPSLKRTEVTEMNPSPKWLAHILSRGLAKTHPPTALIKCFEPKRKLNCFVLSALNFLITSLKDRRLSELAPAVRRNCVVLQDPAYSLKLRCTLTVV